MQNNHYPWSSFVIQPPFNYIRNSTYSTIHENLQQSSILIENRSKILRNGKDHMPMLHIKRLTSNTICPVISKPFTTMSTQTRIATKMNQLKLPTIWTGKKTET